MPIPEKSYLRIVYLGKLRLLPKLCIDDRKSDEPKPKPTLEEMMKEIWEKASKYNRAHFISGHLACCKSLHVVQLLEGEEGVVKSLMRRIRKDPRVVIDKEFHKKLLSMNMGWGISTCYSFTITSAQLRIVKRDDISLERMFQMMKNTHQARREKLKIHDFYKNVIETMLLKYASMEKRKGLKVLNKSIHDSKGPLQFPTNPNE